MEDGAVGLAHHRRQHVQPASVRHADDDVAHAERAAALDDLLERRHAGLAAVEAEPLGAGEAPGEELLETLGLDQLLEDGDLAFRREADFLVATLDPLLDPRLLGGVGDVHVLHADRPAVGALEDVQDLAQGRALEAQHIVEEDRPVPVAFAEAVGRRIELAGVADLGGEPQRIEPRLQVPADAIGPDHHDRAQGIEGAGANLGWVGAGGAGRGRGGRLHLRLRPPPIDRREPVGPLAARELGGAGRRPLRRARRRAVVQRLEDGAPGGVDRGRIGGPAVAEGLDIAGLSAAQEGGLGEDVVQPSAVVRHDFRFWAAPPPRGPKVI